MPKYSITHRTTYAYASPVIQSHHLLHLTPRPVPHQSVSRHSIVIEPAPGSRISRTDYFGNPVVHIALESDHRELSVSALSAVEVTAVELPDFATSSPWEAIADGRHTNNGAPDRSISDYACRSRHTIPSRSILDFARESFPQGTPVLAGAQHMMSRIYEEFTFDATATDVSTPVAKVLEQKAGVCQDFAHVMITALKSLGLPARYVSGYIRTNPPQGGARLVGADASHAWVSVWSPEHGWIDFDPTNNLNTSPDHITIAYGRDYEDVSPISGVLLGGGAHTVAVAVDVVPAQ